MKDEMSTEEREILDRFERSELRPAPAAERELDMARQAARNTFNKTRRVNLRVRPNVTSSSLTLGREKRGFPVRHCCPV